MILVIVIFKVEFFKIEIEYLIEAFRNNSNSDLQIQYHLSTKSIIKTEVKPLNWKYPRISIGYVFLLAQKVSSPEILHKLRIFLAGSLILEGLKCTFPRASTLANEIRDSVLHISAILPASH